MIAFMAPAVFFVAIFIYYPMVSGSQMAFRNWNLNNLTDTAFVGFKNFQIIFADSTFYTVLGNTVLCGPPQVLVHLAHSRPESPLRPAQLPRALATYKPSLATP